jgi:hypothetical protein
MKKVLKTIGVLIIAGALAVGGYICGNKVGYKSGQDSQLSAMPKKTAAAPIESAAPEQTNVPAEAPPAEEKTEPVPSDKAVREIKKQDKSSVDSSWTTVKRASDALEQGTLTLSTSAQKINDEIVWDDSQKWVVEVSDGNGGYYTLYDQNVSNGSVYCDVVKKDNDDKMINVYTMTGAGTTITQYVYSDGAFEEKEVYNSGTVNRVVTTVPEYK